MKRTHFALKMFLSILAIQVVISCNKEALDEKGQKVLESSIENTSGRMPNPVGLDDAYYFTRQEIASDQDLTGRILVKIWAESADGQYPHAEVSVDPGYVMIGGGALVTNFSNTTTGVNALLTAAYPKNDGNFATFVADSKEHLISHNHRLWVYVIGMIVFDQTGSPIPASTLRSQMNIAHSTSSFASHPTTSSNIPSGHILLSGGAKINWSQPGSLLVKSMISGSGWAVKGKDHLQSSWSTIESFALSINPNITNFGVLESSSYIGYTSTSSGQGTLTLNTSAIPGFKWLVSGVGGESVFNGVGRMLFGIYPNSTSSVTIKDKDHSQSDNGTLWGCIIAIKKQ